MLTVSYTHLTLPTKVTVWVAGGGGAVCFKQWAISKDAPRSPT